MDASAAKISPLSRANMNITGADVKGRLMSHPLTAGPHRFLTMLAHSMRMGARVSFRIRMLSSAFSPFQVFMVYLCRYRLYCRIISYVRRFVHTSVSNIQPACAIKL